MSMYYNLPGIAEAADEVSRVYAQTMANHAASIQLLQSNQSHFQSMTAERFAEAITIVNNAYEQAANDIKAAGLAVAQAGENAGQADIASASQYA